MRGDMNGSDQRAISGISLLLNTLDELSEREESATKIGGNIDKRELIGQIERIRAIIGTSGNRSANINLINSLKELNLELTDEFPHQATIDFLVHEVLASYYEAVGAHYQGWEKLRQNTINKAMGSHVILDEPKLFSRSLFGKKKKQKRLKFNVQEAPNFDDYDDEIDYDEDYE